MLFSSKFDILVAKKETVLTLSKRQNGLFSGLPMACPEGFEPTTFWFVDFQ